MEGMQTHRDCEKEGSPVFDADLISRYNGNGPRYTSYPTAAQFQESFGKDDYITAAKLSNELFIPHPLSLYAHIPFCDTVCYYCACNKVVTKNRAHAKKYLAYLIREIEMHAALYDHDRKVVQLHLGGGTPTFFDASQFDVLMATFAQHFSLSGDAGRDFSIEIDPRSATPNDIAHLAALGFNRFSLGVQDIYESVQRAVNRVQSFEQTQSIVAACRLARAASINIDLIYGLPKQSEHTFIATLKKVIDGMHPDRLSIFNYAHLPERFKTQRQIDAADLPSSAQKLKIIERVIETLASAGYVHIGIDHFALPEDALTQALHNHTLQRNFQGYSTHDGCDLVGLGVSAIGKPGHCFYQNAKRLDDYYAKLDDGDLPVERGLKMSADDCIRAEIIQKLSCYYRFSAVDVESRFGIDFKRDFVWEKSQLEKLALDGLVEHRRDEWCVTAKGRLLIRNICAVFDNYQQPSTSSGFSRLI